jgi:hypothetical protein
MLGKTRKIKTRFSSPVAGVVLTAAFALLACSEKTAPDASPSPSQTPVAPPRPKFNISSAQPAKPQPPPTSSAKAEENAPDPVLSFAGFSKDGKRFAYASGSASGAPMTFLWVTEAGSPGAKVLTSVDLDYRGALAEAREKLENEGFSGERKAPPQDLKIKADLTATPPTVTLELAGRKKKAQVGTAPYPETDTATLWGLSPDGSHVAIRIHGPAVKGALTAGAPGRTVTFYRVVPMP